MSALGELRGVSTHSFGKEILKLGNFYILLNVNGVSRQKFAHYLKVGSAISGRANRRSVPYKEFERQRVCFLTDAAILN